MLKMCRLVVTGFIVSTLFGFLVSEDTSCSKVKDEFRKISGEDFVPEFPVIGKFFSNSILFCQSYVNSADPSARGGKIKGKLIITCISCNLGIKR